VLLWVVTSLNVCYNVRRLMDKLLLVSFWSHNLHIALYRIRIIMSELVIEFMLIH